MTTSSAIRHPNPGPPTPKATQHPDLKGSPESEKLLGDMTYHQISENSTLAGVPTGTREEFGDDVIAVKNKTVEQVAAELLKGHVLTMRPSWISIVPYLIIGLIVIVLLFYVSAMIFADGMYVPLNIVFIPICFIAAILHMRFNHKYIISREGVVAVRGILGVHLRRVRIPYNKIGELELRKPLINRIFFLDDSDIYVSVIMFDEPEVRLRGIANPMFYVTLLRLMQKHVLERAERAGETVDPASPAVA